ncbi:MAG: helix-turn-helix transcriptional regulator [Phycisphaerae bacterium]
MMKPKRKLLEIIKKRGQATSAELAQESRLTEVGVRQHLTILEAEGWVESSTRPPTGRGRPASIWRLTDTGQKQFPDTHGELTVALIDAIRATAGEDMLQKVIQERGRRQAVAYQQELAAAGDDPAARVRALAAIRTREGYMAEVREDGAGWLLIEQHCPICDAAKACVGLCGAELATFQSALGASYSVERTHHLLDGSFQCVYRITVGSGVG